MGILGYGYKAYKAIKSVKPGTKTGAESVASWKSKAAKSKLESAKFNLKQTLKKTDKELGKLKKTIKKQKSWKENIDKSNPSYKDKWPG